MNSLMMKGKKKAKMPEKMEPMPEESEGMVDPKAKKKPVGGNKMGAMRAAGCKKGGK